MRIHQAARAIPEMLPDEYEALKADIEKNGLLCPVELLDGKIIDGRHRWKACKELPDIECETVEVDLNGQSPAEYVWSLNGTRRHLTPSQRAAVAVQLLPELKKEAKERQGTRTDKHGVKVDTMFGKSRGKAAAIVGVTPSMVSDAETIKNESPELFASIQKGDIAVSKAKKQLKQIKKDEEDKKAAAKARKAIQDEGDETGVYHGDSFELAAAIPDSSCALIFTDPPYDKKSLHMFYDLGMLASKILVDGGSLITYCGQYVLREVIELVSPEETKDDIDARLDRLPQEGDWCYDDGEPVFNDMRLFWINCCLHTGSVAQMREYGIKVKWKPLLWFVKGDFRRDRQTWVEDLVSSVKQKESHPWQQSLVEAEYYIEKLTKKKELVVDPFCGGGTTAVAARNLSRLWWTADIEAKHVLTARKRLEIIS